MKKLHPNAMWLFLLQNSIGSVFFVIFIGVCFFSNALPSLSTIAAFEGQSLLVLFTLICCFAFFVLIGISYLVAKLTYDNYKYELREDGFYKESGIITKKYVTIPYNRIQNIDIYRGLFARMLGLSDLQIQTAGMSVSYGRNGTYGMGAEGRLPGVSEAEALEIKDEMLKRMKR